MYVAVDDLSEDEIEERITERIYFMNACREERYAMYMYLLIATSIALISSMFTFVYRYEHWYANIPVPFIGIGMLALFWIDYGISKDFKEVNELSRFYYPFGLIAIVIWLLIQWTSEFTTGSATWVMSSLFTIFFCLRSLSNLWQRYSTAIETDKIRLRCYLKDKRELEALTGRQLPRKVSWEIWYRPLVKSVRVRKWPTTLD